MRRARSTSAIAFLPALKPVMSLSGPTIVTELGLVSMGVVDTLVVGRLGPEALGAVGLGNILIMTLAVFGMGLLLGLDTVVSRAYGAGQLQECHRWLLHGVVVALVAALPLVLLARALIAVLPAFGMAPAVLALAIPYMEVSAWAMPSLLLFAAFRRYLLAMSIVRPIAATLIVGNLVNFLLAAALVLGFGPIPSLGTIGSAWATLVTRVALAVALVAIVALRTSLLADLTAVPFELEVARVGRLVTLGIPAALQVTLEVGVFATATGLAAMLDVASLSAHQIVIQVTTLTFIVTLGVGSAGGVLVGQSLGNGDYDGARRMGSAALLAGLCFMSCTALTFVLWRETIVRAFSADASVLEVGGRLLLLAAAFQLFDGLQSVATGVLRGLGDTRTPMFSNLAGHWLLGLPLGYLLAFVFGLGVLGMWLGLSLGLVAIGTFLLATWIRRSRSLTARGWTSLTPIES